MLKTIVLLSFLLLIAATAIPAQKKGVESVYTSLSDKVCKSIPRANGDGGDYRGECPGVSGYKLELLEGDLRQTINVIAPTKKKYELNLWSVVSSGFSALGDKAEWRVTQNGKTATPNSLILRFNASENPEDSSKTTSYLVVVQITKTSACVTDIVKPSADQNAKARELADNSAGKPCKTSE